MTAQGESTASPPVVRPEAWCHTSAFFLEKNIPAGGNPGLSRCRGGI